MEWLLWFAVAWLLWQSIVVAILSKQLYTTDFQRGRYWAVQAEEVPAHVRELLDRDNQALEALGFRLLGYFGYDAVARSATPTFASVLTHGESSAFAIVAAHLLPEPGNPTMLTFVTAYADGSSVMTMNGLDWAVVGRIPRTRLVDPYAATLEAHWRAHLDAHSSEQEAPLAPTEETFVRVSNAQMDGLLEELIAARAVVATEEAGFFRPKFLSAVRWAVGVKRRMGRYHKFLRARAGSGGVDGNTEIPLDVEVDAFFRMKESSERALTRTAKFWLLALTLAISAITFTSFVALTDVALVVGVLLLHELGHWGAMRACGYRDTSIYFLPFFGAVTTGRNDDATIWQRVLVLLAGPLPGLVLGCALLATSTDPVLYRAASMLVGINGINLLPFVPFDGGQVLRLLLVGRHPWLGGAFHLLGITAFAAAGIYLRAPIIVFPALFLAIGFRGTLRWARLSHAIRDELRVASERDAVRAALAWLRSSGSGQLPFAQRYAAAESARAARSIRMPGLFQSLSTVVVYCAALAIGPATWFVLANVQAEEAAECAPTAEHTGEEPASAEGDRAGEADETRAHGQKAVLTE